MPSEEGGGGPSCALHLVSWNVAGWKTSLGEMSRTLGFFGKDATRRSLAAWLDALAVDIFCVQEVKLQSKEVRDSQRAVFAVSDDYESFWACNDGAARSQRSGLNGVATFAKREGPFAVVRADAAPLGSPELDAEGRCVLTDHGAFVVFNCYVPNTAGGARLEYKLRWLAALEAAMRKQTKPVIVTGDLNMKARGRDMHWTRRDLDTGRLADVERRFDAVDDGVRTLLVAWRAKWPAVREALVRRETVETETTNPSTRKKFLRWRVRAPSVVNKTGETVVLGGYETSEAEASAAFEAVGLSLGGGSGAVVVGGKEDAAADDGGGGPVVWLRRPGVMRGCDLAEAFEKLAGVSTDRRVLRRLVESEVLAPEGDGDNPSTRWLRRQLDCIDAQGGGLVDSFVEVHPEARDRFTCWNQYSNSRYSNEGSRIDYVLVSRALFAASRPVAGDLDAGRADGTHKDGALPRDSAEAAHHAATLSGRFEPASFAGGGVPDARATDYAHHRDRPPQTGIIYTPPSWSDHVAVSLKLDAVPVPVPDTTTPTVNAVGLRKNAQPHASTTLITSFFTKGGGAAKKAPPDPIIMKRKAPEQQQPPEKKTIATFFDKKQRPT